jgi:proline racemase
MRARRVLTAVDSHTEGMPTRVVTGGVGVLPGATMFERMRYLVEKRDDLRTLLMYEPRGHAAMSGGILQPPTRPDADVGVVFIEVSGCLPMCGHGTIGTATVLVETGMVEVVEPVTSVRIDTPAGLVVAEVEVDGGRARAVTIRNVPSYLHLRDAEVEVRGLGRVCLDVAWGGNFYAILDAASVGLDVRPERHDELVATGLRVMDAVNEQLTFSHPERPEVDDCRHVILAAPPSGGEAASVLFTGELAAAPPAGAVTGGDGGLSSRAAVVIHPGWVDRSPCGTGTSARMAQLDARGLLRIGQPFTHASLIGTTFVGRLVERTMVGPFPAVVPTVRGRAWITGFAQYLLDPDDPFPAGFLVGGAP